MHWLIQHMKKEASFDSLVELLDRCGLTYSLVYGSVKFNKIVLQSDLSAGLSIEEAPAWLPPKGEKACTLGSYGLAKVAKSLGLSPGAFLSDNLDMAQWLKGWGSNNMLNGQAWIGSLKDAKALPGRAAFIRPCQDTKSFSGEVVDFENFEARKAQLLVSVPEDTSVVVAPLKDIYIEARLFVVNGNIVTYSTYRRGGKVVYEACFIIQPRLIFGRIHSISNRFASLARKLQVQIV
jgi:hypothetical protein